MTELMIDLETYSETPIKDGTYKYAENCEVMLFAYAIDDGPVSVWDITTGAPMPKELAQNLYNPAVKKIAHNQVFDRNALRLGNLKITVPIEQCECTMAQAYAHSLPGALAGLCEALGVHQDFHKHKTGKALVQLFCKPRPKNHNVRRATRLTHPIEWQRFIDYAGQDIEAMRACRKIMPTTNYTGHELALWHLDQKINDRGMLIDTDLALQAIEATNAAQKDLGARTRDMTDGAVTNTTQRDALLAHLLAIYGVELPDMQKATLERRIDDPDLPEPVRELLRIRLQASSTSTAKFKTLVKGTSRNGRLSGTTQFAGAGRTGRWGGRLFQPQNLPRIPLEEDEMERRVGAIRSGCVELLYDDPMKVLSSTIRGAIIAPPGKKLVIADLANIEGRGLAYLAGEEWKLQAFRDYDTFILDSNGARIPDGKGDFERVGPDLYKLAYAKAFAISPDDVTKQQRQIGKVMELMLGYAGGVGAFLTGAATYGIDLEAMTDTALPTIPPHIRKEAESFLDWLYGQINTKGMDIDEILDAQLAKRYGLSERVFVCCDSLKRLWREAHPKTVALWYAVESACRDAINNPGVVFRVRDLAIRRNGAWLRVRLPSGRMLHYPSPQCADNGELSYMGINQYTRKWCRLKTYSGKLVENCIAEGTKVLTSRGWISIENVEPIDLVHDGEEFVRHTGKVFKSVQSCVMIDGVYMTPDHEVLTDDGWQAASLNPRPFRPTIRDVNGDIPLAHGWPKMVLAIPLRLRRALRKAGLGRNQGREAGRYAELRLCNKTIDRNGEQPAWNVEASCLCRLAQHVRSLQVTYPPSVGELWRARHYGLRHVAGVFRELLGGYGADVSLGVNLGAQRQQRGVLKSELRMGYLPGAEFKPSRQRADTDTPRAANYLRSVARLRDRLLDYLLPARKQLAGGKATDNAEFQESRVYDIVNCGPRQRFVVLGDSGPFIVHNCVQAFSRDFLGEGLFAAEEADYPPVLHIHDEIVTETPDSDEFSVEGLCDLMTQPLAWAPGMPLAAAGFEAKRYRKDD